MKNQVSSPNTQNRVILYTAADGKVTADVFFSKETFWLTQRTMAELFEINTPAISKHLKNVYASGELQEEATVSKMETVQMEGERRVTREIEVYNLDAAIAVGYRDRQTLDHCVLRSLQGEGLFHISIGGVCIGEWLAFNGQQLEYPDRNLQSNLRF